MHLKDSRTGGLKAPAWCRRALGAQQRTEDLGWRLGNCEECRSDLAPSSQNHRKGEKQNPTPSPAVARKTNRTHLAYWKSAGDFFIIIIFPPSEAIRPGTVKGLETEPKRHYKANPNNWETETNFTLLFHRTCMLFFICIIIIFHYFHFFCTLGFFISLLSV